MRKQPNWERKQWAEVSKIYRKHVGPYFIKSMLFDDIKINMVAKEIEPIRPEGVFTHICDLDLTKREIEGKRITLLVCALMSKIVKLNPVIKNNGIAITDNRWIIEMVKEVGMGGRPMLKDAREVFLYNSIYGKQ